MPLQTGNVARLADVRLEYRWVGADRTQAPIVFLHEGLGSVAMWRDFPDQLCATTGRSGLVYSRRGYGQSTPIEDVRGPHRPPAPGSLRLHGRHGPDYMHREAWDVLPLLLAELGIERPVLYGHSDGGTIALLYASRHPVAACIVAAPHVVVEKVSTDAIAKTRDAYLDPGPRLRQRLAKFHADVDGAFWSWNDVWLSEPFSHMDIRQDCARITAPLLAIQGLDDEYGSMRQIDDIAVAAPHTQLLKLPACGHSPHKDQPQAVADTITRFLTGV